MFLVDSHCHIDQLDYIKTHKNINDVLKKAINNDVNYFLNVSMSLCNFKKMYETIKIHKNIFFSCGVHPLKCQPNYPYTNDLLFNLSKYKKVIAIGETGLDYSYKNIHKQLQIISFRNHIKISILLKKPIIIHTRNSIQEIISILQESEFKHCIGILHCFTENLTSLKKILNMGFYISLSGIITFKNAYNLRKIIKYIPMDRLLLETDSPYLSPVPYRGNENQPANLKYIAQHISHLLKKDICEIITTTTYNFENLFNLKLTP